MTRSKTNLRVAAFGALCVAVALAGMACPTTAPTGVAKVTTVFTSDSGSVANKLIAALTGPGPVDVADIESLEITITRITLDYDNPEDGEPEEEAEGEKFEDSPNKIVVFEGSETVDLIDLQGVNRLISLAEAPAGKYTKIRISFENPVLVLTSDPNTELTNIQVTANGHLFISQMFELPEGQESVLQIDFGGLHLVELGNGNFVLTPQLQVNLAVGVVEATTVAGEIVAIDTEIDVITILTEGGDEIVVDYIAALIFLPEDTDTANGSEGDLAIGQMVEATGSLFPDGILEADSIRILPEETPEEEEPQPEP
jgi:hypothetical protein